MGPAEAMEFLWRKRVHLIGASSVAPFEYESDSDAYDHKWPDQTSVNRNSMRF